MRGALLAALLLLAVPAAASAKEVLVVGDSLEVGTGPYLPRALPHDSVTVDAKKSRPSNVGVDLLRSRLKAGQAVVVFDLGTNDDPGAPGRLTADLEAARQLSGDRCLVVATLNRPAVGGISVAGLNRAVTSFANATANVEVVDWHAAARQDPGLLGPDGVHATPSGYAERARLVADAVETCLAGGSTSAARPPAPRHKPRAVAPAAPQPSRIDWATFPGAVVTLGYLRSAIGFLAGAVRITRAALGGPLPEPVLGKP